MATKADFTEEEWKALQKGVTGAGMLVSVSDRDFTDTFGEASALAKYMAAQHETNESPLIREIAASKGSGFGMTASTDKVEAETFAVAADRAGDAPGEGAGRRRGLPSARAGRRGARREREGRRNVPTEAATIERIKEAVGAA